MASLYDSASLVMIPSGVKEDKLYSIKPTDGSGDFTFSRGSDIEATRVNSSGLIEKAKVNNLLQSNSFSNASWVNIATTETSGQSGYDGSSDAWLLSATGANAAIYQSITEANVITFSCYIKAGTSNWCMLRLNGSSNNLYYVDLSTRTFGTISGVLVDGKIEDVGGGWSRVSVTANQTSYISAFVYVAAGDNSLATTNETIYIQDAQLNYGLVAQDYIETTTTAVVEGLTADLPRLDYSGGASCPSLLLEPSRTNAINHSEYIAAGVTWSASNAMATESNSIISPEGVQNATKLIRPANSNAAWIREGGTSVTIGQDQTISVFAKEGNEPIFNITYFDATDGDRFFNFNLSTEAISGNGLSHASYVDSGIEDYGSGWYRCYIVVEAGDASPQIQLAVGSNRGAQASEYLYIYGAQLESNASYPTSYIPTYGTAAVRGDEDVDLTSASAIIGQTEGVMFMEYDITNLESGYDWFGFNDNGITNRLILGVSDSSTQGYRLFVVSGGTTSIDTRFGNTTAGGVVKVAVKYDNGSYKVFVNGSEGLSTTGVSSFASTLTDIDFNDGSTLRTTEPVKQFLVFPNALTDAECISLTTI